MVDKLNRAFSEDNLTRLAKENPQELIKLIEAEAHAADLHLALYKLGELAPREQSISVLIKHLQHSHPLVREGALTGLADLDDDPVVRQALLEVSNSDPNQILRRFAASLLE